MAKISKSADAPADATHFTLANDEIDLPNADSVFETDNARLIANAQNSKLLQVELDPVTVTEQGENYDPNDPHDNPQADALSLSASPAAIAAAAANNAAIQQSAGVEATAPVEQPTVAEQKADTFDALGIDQEPAVAVADEVPVTAATPASSGDTKAATPSTGSAASSGPVLTTGAETSTPATSSAGSQS